MLQYWIMYLPYILGPAFLLSGCIVLTLESSDPWYSGTHACLHRAELCAVPNAVVLCMPLRASLPYGGLRLLA